MKAQLSTLRSVLALTLLLVSTSFAPADEPTRNLIRNTLRATAWVRTSAGNGTAWMVDRDRRLLITNHHVVLNEDQVEVYFPIYGQDGRVITERTSYTRNRALSAKVIDTDVPRDLAILQLVGPVPAGVRELKLAATAAEAGDRVHSIGNPGASDALWVYTSGTVRAVYHRRWAHRNEATHARYERSARVVETQSPLNHGDSGGPVVNDKGDLVAVVSSGKTADRQGPVQLMSQCIDASEVRAVLENVGRLLEPKSAADFCYRADRRRFRHRFADAIADYTEALRQDSNYANAYFGRGWTFGEQGDYDTAIGDYNQYIHLAPNDAVGFNNRGHYFLRQKNEEKALADFTRAIQLNPQYAMAYDNRGWLYGNRKEYRRAIADCTRAIEIDPTMAYPWKNRAFAHYKLGEQDQAIADAERALKLDLYLVDAWNFRGWAMHEKKSYDAAIDNFRAALKLFPRNARFYASLANAFTGKGDWRTSIPLYNRSIELNPNDGWTYYNRGNAYQALEDSRASADFAKALQLDPSLKGRIKSYSTKLLKVVNNTGEKLRVCVQYEYKADGGGWAWWPQAPGSDSPRYEYWDIPAGQSWVLVNDGWTVKARRVRLWAKGLTSNRVTNTYWGTDLWLAPQPYYGTRHATFIDTINAN